MHTHKGKWIHSQIEAKKLHKNTLPFKINGLLERDLSVELQLTLQEN